MGAFGSRPGPATNSASPIGTVTVPFGTRAATRRLRSRLRRASVGGLSHKYLSPPLPETDQGDVEVKPHTRELVVVAILPGAVRDGLEDPLFDQSVEAIGEDVAGDAEALLELVEPSKTQEGVPNDQEGPPLAHKLEGARYRAILPLVLAVQHTRHTTGWVA